VPKVIAACHRRPQPLLPRAGLGSVDDRFGKKNHKTLAALARAALSDFPTVNFFLYDTQPRAVEPAQVYCSAMVSPDRRRFPRVNLAVLYRPAGLLGPRRLARDFSRGGIRVFTDDPLAVGTRLEIELFLPEGDSLSVDVRVAWLNELQEQESRYEAGLEFLVMDEVRRGLLERCLADHEVGDGASGIP
jgi:hypothetical protein